MLRGTDFVSVTLPAWPIGNIYLYSTKAMSNEFYLFIHIAATTSLHNAAAMPFLLTTADCVSKWLRGHTTDSQHATSLFLVVSPPPASYGFV